MPGLFGPLEPEWTGLDLDLQGGGRLDCRSGEDFVLALGLVGAGDVESDLVLGAFEDSPVVGGLTVVEAKGACCEVLAADGGCFAVGGFGGGFGGEAGGFGFGEGGGGFDEGGCGFAVAAAGGEEVAGLGEVAFDGGGFDFGGLRGFGDGDELGGVGGEELLEIGGGCREGARELPGYWSWGEAAVGEGGFEAGEGRSWE